MRKEVKKCEGWKQYSQENKGSRREIKRVNKINPICKELKARDNLGFKKEMNI